MTDWELRPHEGVGPLELGMTRDDCRAAFEGRFEEYVKGPSDDRTTDIFAGAVHVYYDEQDRAEYIEISRGSGVSPTFGGVALLDVEPATAVAAVERAGPYDPDDPELGYSYTFTTLDLSLWRPVTDESEPEGRTFATVGIGVHDYYTF